MKIPQYFLILTAIAFATTACAQNVSGNGDVVEENRPVEPFSSIDIGGVLNVYLTQGDTESVTVEADENLLDLIITENPL